MKIIRYSSNEPYRHDLDLDISTTTNDSLILSVREVSSPAHSLTEVVNNMDILLSLSQETLLYNYLNARQLERSNKEVQNESI